VLPSSGTDEDFAVPLLAGYFPWPRRVDDGRPHRVRLTYSRPGGGSLAAFVDDLEKPVLTTALDLQGHALDEAGRGFAGFTAASSAVASSAVASSAAGAPSDAPMTARVEDEVAVEVLDWQLATFFMETVS
jgi:hypothetical protein